jgi:hypothetical protein
MDKLQSSEADPYIYGWLIFNKCETEFSGKQSFQYMVLKLHIFKQNHNFNLNLAVYKKPI